MFTVRLSDAELVELTEYEQPTKQLQELHRQGFYRARIGRTGRVILERAHYDAVARGEVAPPVQRQPRLRTA
jgi:hypothetical protein